MFHIVEVFFLEQSWAQNKPKMSVYVLDILLGIPLKNPQMFPDFHRHHYSHDWASYSRHIRGENLMLMCNFAPFSASLTWFYEIWLNI